MASDRCGVLDEVTEERDLGGSGGQAREQNQRSSSS
jgi:hypothetical protein